MKKHVNAAGYDAEPSVRNPLFHFLLTEVSPEDAGHKAGKEAFDGLGARIIAFVSQQRSIKEHCTD